MDDRRRVRVTIRCLVDDLGIPLPGPEVDLGELEHPLLEECRRLAPTAPLSQKRVLSIDPPPVFRVAHGRWRGATWVEEELRIMWLLAAEMREEGAASDAYEHFLALHTSRRLLPTENDHLRLRVEDASRALAAIEADLAELVTAARSNPGSEQSAWLGSRVEAAAYVEREDALELIWLAVCCVDRDGLGVVATLRDLVFATAEALLAGAEWEWVGEWPGSRELRWFEVARLGLREA